MAMQHLLQLCDFIGEIQTARMMGQKEPVPEEQNTRFYVLSDHPNGAVRREALLRSLGEDFTTREIQFSELLYTMVREALLGLGEEAFADLKPVQDIFLYQAHLSRKRSAESD